MSFLDAFMKRRRREPFDERLPSGVAAMNVGIPEWQRRQMGLDLPNGESVNDLMDRIERPATLDLLNRGGEVESPRVTPQTPEPATRPRTVTPAPTEPPTEQQGGSFIDAFTRDRRTQPRDYVNEGSAYVRDLERQPRNWKDKIVDVTDALNAVAGGRKRVIPTKRERGIAEAQGQLERDVEIQKQDLNKMVPVTLEDGTQVMVPARTAGPLQSQQQGIKTRREANTERQRMNSARINNWNSMSSDRRQRLLADLYKSGGMNDPELLEYAADQLGLPATLREKFIAGQMRDAIDEEGNLIQVNRQTGAVTEGPRSYETVKEAGRDRRATEGIASRERVAQMPARSSGARGATTDRAAQRKAAQLIGIINRARGEMESADKAGNKTKREAARLAGEQAAAELNALNAGYEAGPGEGGYPYFKQTAAPQGQAQSPSAGGSFNMKGWLKSHPNATEVEKSAIRQRAKDRQLVIVE